MTNNNSRRNRRDVTTHDDDDYVYPTKKIRETKTRNRKYSANLIKAGLTDHENLKFDEFEQEGEDDQPNDPNFLDYEIRELIEEFGDTDTNVNTDTDPNTDIDDEYEDAVNDIYGSYNY